jgi:predicted dehydrogenase
VSVKSKDQPGRRKFLKTTRQAVTGALVFPHIVPSFVLGRAGPVPPSDKINIGCVGLGGQGTRNMQQFIAIPDAEVVALCDVNSGSDNYDMLYQYPGSVSAGIAPAIDRAIKWYAESDVKRSRDSFAVFSDFRELLTQQDIDAVSVCTPDHWHALVSIAAAKAGKDIYCEKPLANSIPEGRAVCDAVQRYGRVLQTGSHERSNDSVRFACELVQNGRIGRLITMRVSMPNKDNHHKKLLKSLGPRRILPVPENFDFDMWLGPAPGRKYVAGSTHFWWRYILDFGGGEMTDRGAHIIDLAQLANDADDTCPVEIIGHGQAPETGIYNSFMDYEFECRYANGVRLLGSSQGERGLTLEGTDGWIFIHIHGGRLTAEPAKLLRETFGPNEIHLGRSPGHHQNFLNSVRDRTKPLAHAELGHHTSSICHLLNLAFLTDRKLLWDPVTEQISNDAEANRMVNKPMRSPWSI